MHASERDTLQVQQARVDYWQTISSIALEDLVFIDEAGVNLAMVRLYARSLRGRRAIGTRSQRRGQNVSMVEALTINGPIATIQILGAMNGLTFEAYLIRRVVPNLWPGACVVIDNSPTHHQSEEMKAALDSIGARLIYLPPYSPDFSPIENFWSKVKNTLKSIGARTYQALKQAIKFAYEQVSLQDIEHWFTFCGYHTSLN